MTVVARFCFSEVHTYGHIMSENSDHLFDGDWWVKSGEEEEEEEV